MTITFGSDQLASPGREGVADLRIAHQRAAQEQDLVRSEGPFQKDRKNRTTEISFTTSKEHASLSVAELYLLDLETTLDGQADLTLAATGGNRYLNNAILIGLEVAQNGVTTVQRFTFRGSYIETTT